MNGSDVCHRYDCPLIKACDDQSIIICSRKDNVTDVSAEFTKPDAKYTKFNLIKRLFKRKNNAKEMNPVGPLQQTCKEVDFLSADSIVYKHINIYDRRKPKVKLKP